MRPLCSIGRDGEHLHGVMGACMHGLGVLTFSFA